MRNAIAVALLATWLLSAPPATSQEANGALLIGENEGCIDGIPSGWTNLFDGANNKSILVPPSEHPLSSQNFQVSVSISDLLVHKCEFYDGIMVGDEACVANVSWAFDDGVEHSTIRAFMHVEDGALVESVDAISIAQESGLRMAVELVDSSVEDIAVGEVIPLSLFECTAFSDTDHEEFVNACKGAVESLTLSQDFSVGQHPCLE